MNDMNEIQPLGSSNVAGWDILELNLRFEWDNHLLEMEGW